MIFFGPLSSIFDFATFQVIVFIFHAKDSLFQSGWLIESIATKILLVFAIRKAHAPFFSEQPTKWLIITCISLAGVCILLPFRMLATHLELVILGFLIMLIAANLILVKTVKNLFFKKYTLLYSFQLKILDKGN